jgi:uncharacterized protein YndB with AHSA1/START domain
MTTRGDFTVATRGDREIVMTRTFDAPRALVFDAFSKPEYLQRWLLGPDGWTMPVCDVDFKVGGKWRYVWRKGDHDMGSGGVFKQIVVPERIVNTEQFDDPWYKGESVVTTSFVEKNGRTTVEMVMAFDSKETRDGALKSGMESGVAVSYDRLDDILAARVRR